ncbi:GDP-mannose 4,6-dehydratase [Fusobacterium sp. IOR10]|uniref:GDP-mannose 4,6-dehydratase n=1 Tax=Fusobacterium sp. IOR10 TaxID=2665157 RepID=UPI0013D85932|nr:GDP-mannose 4,6-dehydratase [Fusobacterium sp. IOR10]
MNKKYLITGAAGFIGYYLSKKLLEKGETVIGIDNINDYYDVNLKHARLGILKKYENFKFTREDISNKEKILEIFKVEKPNIVVNLAAQAGVRYSIENPDVYIKSNVEGFFNVLEACRYYPVEHLIYASSSSVYGNNKKVPFEESDSVDNPVSLYAATKKSNELMAYTYSHLYKIPATGLRFFTVYGPMGRPDMAYFGFTDKYFNNEEIHIYNNGDFENDLYRDFTYVDDIVEGIEKLIDKGPNKDNLHRVFNIGNNNPEKLMTFILTLEKCLSKSLNKDIEFKKIYEPIKAGDVPKTYASTDKLQLEIGFKPKTSIEEGLQKFTDWYVKYYRKL